MAMDQYLYIPFLGDEHPFTSYFDVHQGDRVLTHPQITLFFNTLMLKKSHVSMVKSLYFSR
jgi:hypothetical protein